MDDRDERQHNSGNYRDRFGLNGRIMLTAIICLFVVVALVVLLHIYSRCVLRRQARRRAALRRISMVTGTTTTTTQLNSSGQPNKGLDQSIISSLPIFTYTKADDFGEAECSVCLSTLVDGEIVRLLPNCKHTFHSECIDMWLTTHSTCPICRTEAEPLPQPSESAVTLPVDLTNASLSVPTPAPESEKVGGSNSRLNSFRRIMSRDTSSNRIQPNSEIGDIERQ